MQSFSDNYISAEIIQSHTLKTTLQDTLLTLQRLVPASGGHSIVLWDNEQKVFTEGAATVRRQPDGTVERRVRRKDGASRWIVDNSQPLAAHTQQDPFGANSLLDEYSIRSYLGVPLVHNETAIGVLYALSTSRYDYTPEDIRKLQDYAHFVTITIANIQLTQTLYEVNQTLRREQNQLEAIFNSIPEILYVKDTNGRILRVNNRAIPYYKVKSIDEIVGKTDYDLMPLEDAQASEQEDAFVISTGKPIMNKEIHVTQVDLPDDWLLTTKVPFYNAEGDVVGIVGSTRIITERKVAVQREEALKAQKLQVKMLQDFINSVAHDFRTPLSVIKTSVYIIKKRHSELVGESLNTISKQTERLISLVDDMITMVKLDMLVTLELIPQSLSPIIEIIVDELMPMAHENNQSISIWGFLHTPSKKTTQRHVLGQERSLSNNSMSYCASC